jgi:hypothetical protein
MWVLVPHPATTTDFILGLSLGQPMEHTALAILRRDVVLDDAGKMVQDAAGDDTYKFDCVGLERFTVGMSYPAIAAAVAKTLAAPALQPVKGQNRPTLALEITGVGKSVVDLFINSNLPADIEIITSTGGIDVVRDAWPDRSGGRVGRWYKVPKQDLVAVVQVMLQAERIKFAGTLALAPTLRRELHDFRPTPARSDELSGREHDDDDLVFAVAAALWFGNRHTWNWNKPLFY